MGATPQGFCYFLIIKSKRRVNKFYSNLVQKVCLRPALPYEEILQNFLVLFFCNDTLVCCASNLPLFFVHQKTKKSLTSTTIIQFKHITCTGQANKTMIIIAFMCFECQIRLMRNYFKKFDST